MRVRKKKYLGNILLLIYLAAVAYLCFGNFESMSEISKTFLGIPTDKLVHFLMFFPFPFLVFLAIDKYTTKPWHSALFAILTFIAGCLLAGASEIGQSLTSYRECDIKDFLADALSLAVSSLIVFIIDILKQNPDES